MDINKVSSTDPIQDNPQIMILGILKGVTLP